jgi:hypothetical protein
MINIRELEENIAAIDGIERYYADKVELMACGNDTYEDVSHILHNEVQQRCCNADIITAAVRIITSSFGFGARAYIIPEEQQGVS